MSTKEELEKALEYAETMLKEYNAIPAGRFGAAMITMQIDEAKEVLKAERAELYPYMTEKLRAIE